MTKQFQGSVSLDIRDSTPDGHRSTRPGPEGSPNVVYIVLDDVGFSAMAATGAPSRRPTSTGSSVTGCATPSGTRQRLCSPTRSCLLTGRNHTRNSMACITEAAIGFPNASGVIPPENGTLAEVLGDVGGTPTWWASGTYAPSQR